MPAINMSKDPTPMVNASGTRLTKATFGFGWDSSSAGEKGLMGRLNRAKGTDLDASVIAFDSDKDAIGCAFYGNLRVFGGAMLHNGDSRKGKGDDAPAETIDVDFDELPAEVEYLACVLSSFKGASFATVNNATFQIFDQSEGNNATALGKVYLPVQGAHTAAIMAVAKRLPDGSWEIKRVKWFGTGKTWEDIAGYAVGLLG